MIRFMSRRVYDRQFKMAAVQLVLEEDTFVKEVAKELSIHSNTLYHWISEYEEWGKCVSRSWKRTLSFSV
ncbi:hypothetical protein bcgnr5376_54380 [Bacillus cereus]